MRLIFRCLLVLLSVCLVGCQTSKGPTLSIPPKEGWKNDTAFFDSRQRWLDRNPSWALTAKVGIKAPNIRESANLVWDMDDARHTMRMFGPLGLGSVRVDFDANGAKLTDNKGNVHRGDNAQALLSRIVGWQIPVDALQYWVFALPEPGYAFQYMSGQDGGLMALEQRGWQIQYSRYLPLNGDGRSMPKKIVATRLGATNNSEQTVSVRLMVKSWTVKN